MTACAAALGAGTRVLYDGQAWEVAELTPPSVLLAAAGGLRRVSISHLLAAAGTRIGGTPAAARPADAGAAAGRAGRRGAGRAAGAGGSRAGGVHRLPPGQPGACPARRAAAGVRARRRQAPAVSGQGSRAAASGSGRCAGGRRAWSGTARPGSPMTGTCAARRRRAGPMPGGWRWPARCWPSTPTPAPRPRTWSWPGSRPALRLSTVPGRCRSRARPGRVPCCWRSAGARPRSAGRRPGGRSPAARPRPTGGCAATRPG